MQPQSQTMAMASKSQITVMASRSQITVMATNRMTTTTQSKRSTTQKRSTPTKRSTPQSDNTTIPDMVVLKDKPMRTTTTCCHTDKTSMSPETTDMVVRATTTPQLEASEIPAQDTNSATEAM